MVVSYIGILPQWENFVNTVIDIDNNGTWDDILSILNQEYSASLVGYEALEFETDQDYMEFMLRWS